MKKESAIQWTDYTWNIARGCSKVDADCKFCYMYRDSFDGHRYNPREVVRTKSVFDLPLRIKEKQSKAWDGKPLVFTCSLTDFFHEGCDIFRMEAWDIIRKSPDLIFQVLTKRPDRNLPAYWEEVRNRVWLGTSIGHQDGIHRLSDLIVPIQPGIKFLSLEPLHGPIDLGLNTYVDDSAHVHNLIDWVIVGGESGNDNGSYKYRPCKIEWIENIVEQCKKYDIPVFVKQMGTYLSKQMIMSDRHGGNINEFPEHLRLREFPKAVR
jgi:protein gp37